MSAPKTICEAAQDLLMSFIDDTYAGKTRKKTALKMMAFVANDQELQKLVNSGNSKNIIKYRLVDPSEPEPKTCFWNYDGDMYETECGTAFYFNDGTTQENNANYCHKCGNRIEVVENDE